MSRKNHGSKSDDVRLINIRYKDGKMARIPRGQAFDIVRTGKAKYISNSAARKPGGPLYREANQATKAKNIEAQRQKAADRREKRQRNQKSG